MIDPIPGIIILEGADSSGKSTLATCLRAKYGARYIHCGLYQNPLVWHQVALRRAIRLGKHELCVVDRHWPSHLIYGSVFNNQKYEDEARELDRQFREACALIVLCVPGSASRQEQDWLRDKGNGKKEHFTSVREVIALYADLAYGNVANPAPGYLGELIRFQDFAERPDVTLYDRYEWDGRVEAYARGLIKKVESLRYGKTAVI